MLVVKGSTIATRIITLFLLARMLGPTEYGSIAYVLSIVEIIRQIADFGMDTYAIRHYTLLSATEKRQQFANTFASLRLIFGVSAYLLWIVFALYNHNNRLDLVIILGLLINSGLWTNYAINYFQAELRVASVIVPVLSMNVITIVLLAVLLNIPNVPVLLLLSILPFGESIATIALLYRMNKELSFTILHWSPQNWRHLIVTCFPIAITSIVVIAYSRLDVLVLNYLTTPTEVGYYSAAARLIDPFLYIPLYLSISVYSAVSSAIASNLTILKQTIKTNIIFLASYGIIACLFLQIVASFVTTTLLPNYGPSLPVIRVLALLLLCRTTNYGLTALIQAFGKFTWVTFVAIWNLIFIGVCAPILTQSAGIQGTAIALLLGELLNTLIQIILFRSILNIHVKNSMA
jgi:O-antigen/teichoic acid export membrane protein